MQNKSLSEIFLDEFSKGKKNIDSWDPRTFLNAEASVDVLDFFCCAGGMSLGFASLNDLFHVLGGVDINPVSLKSYHSNYHTPVLQADITTLTENSKEINDTFHIDPKRPLVVIGCAPCQGFSAHRKKDSDKPEDKRNTLIGYFAEIAVTLQPDYVVMENVPEILTGKYKNHYEEAKKVFENYGYHVTQRVYNAAGFGVPQVRTRAIIVATRNKSFVLPDEILSVDEYKTVRDAIGNLPEINPKDQHPKDI